MAFNFTSRIQYQVTRYLYDYGDDCAATYNAASSEDEADLVITNPIGYIVVGQSFIASEEFRICRGLATYDLSDLSPSEDVVKAVLTSMGANVKKVDGIEACIFDGTGLTGVKADYGAIGALSTILGLAYIPDLNGFDGDYPFSIEFNSLGLEFLEGKAGGIATIAFKASTDHLQQEPGNDCPIYTGYEEFLLENEQYKHKLHINSEPGYIWVEGPDIAYLDGYYFKRLAQGTTTGGSGTAGQIWVEGTYFHYIDSSGNERRIEGTDIGNYGAIPGQIYINYGWFRYIDIDGHLRYIAGSLAS